MSCTIPSLDITYLYVVMQYKIDKKVKLLLISQSIGVTYQSNICLLISLSPHRFWDVGEKLLKKGSHQMNEKSKAKYITEEKKTRVTGRQNCTLKWLYATHICDFYTYKYKCIYIYILIYTNIYISIYIYDLYLVICVC